MLWQKIKRSWHLYRRKNRSALLDPDEVLLDAFNLPAFDTDQFEGRVSHPISRRAGMVVGIFFILLTLGYAYRAWDLQISRGSDFVLLSEKNRLRHNILFAERGVIYDRHGTELAWNVPGVDFAKRIYLNKVGLSHVLGFVGYPQKDSAGNWWRKEYAGKSGVERSFNDLLAGQNGLQIEEVSATLDVQSANTLRKSVPGKNLTLAIDSDLHEALYSSLKRSASSAGYTGGAAVVVDVNSGEVVSLVSYPEFDSLIMSDGTDKKKIRNYSTGTEKVFLNRTISATYAPGSIVKPYVAASALAEGVISQWKQIYSSGALIIPNPYHPSKPSRFLDWKAHGLVDMRHAIAVSSNIYFYAVGGGLDASLGLGAQEGLGINKLAAYAKRFGFGVKSGIELMGEKDGNVPTKRWKMETFGENWLLGNTYHSSIGQYGWLVTPLQAALYVGAIANGGELLTPNILKSTPKQGKSIGIKDKHLQVVREGMRLAVTQGTLKSLNYDDMSIAAKTGTAQVGRNNEFKNSWVIGFWPSQEPRFAFAIVLERAPAYATYGAVNTSIDFFNWLRTAKPEYKRGNYPPMVEDSTEEQ